MRILVTEDDFTSRHVLTGLLSRLGHCDVAVDGREAVSAVSISLKQKEPYDLICLDIMMPNMNGQEALARIRELESEAGMQPGDGAKVMMTTALNDSRNILQAFNGQCEAYLVKPITRARLVEQIRLLGLDPSPLQATESVSGTSK
ncbi:MAG: response regulator [Phycisphaeraceae bacterium]|nr:response regulator [Phycisphaeraceae bacterium]